jgi:dCMP deaminase
MSTKWDKRFLLLAKMAASWSKDPSTKVGAIIVNQQRRVVGLGYNGLPRGVPDSDTLLRDRVTKYPMTVHAEMNAILNSWDLNLVKGTTLYVWPMFPCADCAKAIIQSGVRHVVYPEATADAASRWHTSWAIAVHMFSLAGVTLQEVSLEDLAPDEPIA